MRAVIYCRISEDSLGEGLGVQRQQEDCEALAKSLGLAVQHSYTDNDISAAGQAKTRPEWDAMLADAKAGKFDVILAYSNSRLTRRLAELETMIQLHDQHGIVVNTVVSGQDDLSTADGRMVARIKASVDAAEAERVGERVSRAARQRAEQGKPQAGRYRLFGYNADWSLNDKEASLIKEAFERRAKGESTTAIAGDFTKRGIKTVAGNDWKSGTLGVTLKKPIYCGLREYKGEVIGDSSVPAIVDQDTFYAAQSNLANDSAGTNARKYLLSGILLCSKCLSPMKGNPASQMYRCSATYGGCGKLSVRIKIADQWITHAAMQRYTLGVGNAKTTKTVDYRPQIEELETTIARLQEGFAAGIYTLKEVTPQIKAKRDELKKLEAAAAKQSPSITKLHQQYLDFSKANLSQKRAFISEHITNVVVYPSISRGNQPFNPARFEVHYPDGTYERLEREDNP